MNFPIPNSSKSIQAFGVHRRTVVTITRPATGPRVHVIGIRVHHGAAGLALAAIGTICHSPTLVLIGFAAMLHDLHDLPWTTDR